NGAAPSVGACHPACPARSPACGTVCTNPLTDDAHCGGRPGTACTANSGTSCQGGQCKPTCDSSRLTNCPAVGCVDTQNDAANCGTCGNGCTGGKTCISGSCLTVCPAGQQLCSGVCKDTKSDSQNCGGCGVGCSA